MKALIIYDNINSALKAANALRTVADDVGTHGVWTINLWRENVMKFPSLADEALKEALDADLLVFAGVQICSLPRWLKDWMERWVANRRIPDAAIAVIDDAANGLSSAVHFSELSRFAHRHHLTLIANTRSESREIRSVVALGWECATPAPFEAAFSTLIS
jgi:hypothetical protein